LKFDSHRDEWDSVQDNKYLSAEAVRDLLRQVFQVYATPDLKTPEYEVRAGMGQRCLLGHPPCAVEILILMDFVCRM
jgi:hypothetical protein